VQVVSVQEHWVKPRSADINENVLSESTKEELGLCEDLIRKGQSLDQVVSQVTNKIVSFLIRSEIDRLWCLVTGGVGCLCPMCDSWAGKWRRIAARWSSGSGTGELSGFQLDSVAHFMKRWPCLTLNKPFTCCAVGPLWNVERCFSSIIIIIIINEKKRSTFWSFGFSDRRRCWIVLKEAHE
jgi:hypothetical protein